MCSFNKNSLIYHSLVLPKIEIHSNFSTRPSSSKREINESGDINGLSVPQWRVGRGYVKYNYNREMIHLKKD